MFNLLPLVYAVLAIIGIAIVLGILWWLVNWLAKEWALPEIIIKLVRTLIVVASALFAIFIIIWIFGGFGAGQLFRWGP